MSTNDKPPSRDIEEELATPAGDVVMIYATFPDRQAAMALGRELVEQGLAGCINVLPAMTSIYVWKGETETAEEAVLIAKLARQGADRAVAHIVANHPYETPAVLVVPVVGGSSDYLNWVISGTRP
ncbi:divalent-cation tolerance protein CutA [Hyphomicrobium facile]|uniref:Divalent cation tolerance protein n=1 Tax=Hyphomicrobium facile TaxID=51670 RepID=A0A1I7NBC2_9HYPH|nr:divalent-cation tolerance protein CutA [Hyphomicrobium facile]SFV31977.1 divalent cation tolerance protein [Hyphomicrobium facile]